VTGTLRSEQAAREGSVERARTRRSSSSPRSVGQMTPEEDPADLEEGLMESELRLRSIRELAMDQVLVEGSTEQKLVDTEIRLRRITPWRLRLEPA
jgi:hypothetical protein